MNILVKELIEKQRLKTPEIISAFKKIDRADFMNYKKDLTYIDNAFPIGHGQTISQPTTVAIMLELLQPKKGDRVLDIGSGSGWTTALLAKIVGPKGKVYSIEIIKELYQFGKENVEKYQFKNIKYFNTDGSKGLLKYAPYDRILASASVDQIPQPLKNQLDIYGFMVLPVKDLILKVTKNARQRFKTEEHPFFSFVPMRGKYGKS